MTASTPTIGTDAAADLEHPLAAPAPAVALRGVHFTWPGERRFALTVDDLRIAAGERVLLLGPSGSGKSTLLSLITGIVAPDAGTIAILGTDITKLGPSARDRFRAEHIGVVFQMFNLLAYASARDNVLLALAFAPYRRRRATAAGPAAHEADRLLARLGLAADVADTKASSLSVGQQQRVAVARALIGRPGLVIADEPTSALDRAAQVAFLDLLASESVAAGAALLMVSHDETLAGNFDRLVRLDAVARIATAGAAGAGRA
ncbi:MAG: ABC transporter ATP-binding protein [Hyphomicrobiaceae bacterium]